MHETPCRGWKKPKSTKNVLPKGNILGSGDVRNQRPSGRRYADRKSYRYDSCPSKLAKDYSFDAKGRKVLA